MVLLTGNSALWLCGDFKVASTAEPEVEGDAQREPPCFCIQLSDGHNEDFLPISSPSLSLSVCNLDLLCVCECLIHCFFLITVPCMVFFRSMMKGKHEDMAILVLALAIWAAVATPVSAQFNLWPDVDSTQLASTMGFSVDCLNALHV